MNVNMYLPGTEEQLIRMRIAVQNECKITFNIQTKVTVAVITSILAAVLCVQLSVSVNYLNI